MKTSSIEEAKAAGLTQYFSGKPCKWGHISPRCVSSRGCVECQRWRRARDPEKAREASRKWRVSNPEQAREESRARASNRRAAEPDKTREAYRKWRASNVEKAREATCKWGNANRAERSATQSARRALKLNATPSWVDLKAVARIYQQCAWLTMASGVKHEVDHFYPLRGKTVCGLHAPANLRVITAVENAAKGNRLAQMAGL